MTEPLALIIEDDDDLSEIFSRTLRRGGFETEIVHDGQLALERLQGIPPAIIVLDLHLPRIMGATILQQIRASERFSKTAVIVTTADARLADDMRGKADLVLLKPVSVDQLRDLAKRLMLRWDVANPVA